MDNKIQIKIIPISKGTELLDIDLDTVKSSVLDLDRGLIRMDVIGGGSQMEKNFCANIYKLMSEEQKQAINIMAEQRLNQLSNLKKSHYLNDKYEEIHSSSSLDDIQNICKTCNYKSSCDYHYHRLRDNKNGEMMCYNNSLRKECKMQISEFVDAVSRDKLEYLMDAINSMHKLID